MAIEGTSPLPIPGTTVRPSAVPLGGAGAVRAHVPAAVRPAAPPPAPVATRPVAPARTVSVEPPPGTDPELWSILTADERAYFASTAALGPLTYPRVMSSHRTAMPPVARGGRLDVRG